MVGPCESLFSGVLMGLRCDPSTLTSFLSTPHPHHVFFVCESWKHPESLCGIEQGLSGSLCLRWEASHDAQARTPQNSMDLARGGVHTESLCECSCAHMRSNPLRGAWDCSFQHSSSNNAVKDPLASLGARVAGHTFSCSRPPQSSQIPGNRERHRESG